MKRSISRKTVRAALSAAAVGGVVFTLAACSGGGAAPQTGSDAPAGQADTPTMKIAMITHGPTGDPFWDMVQKGAEAAAKKDNVDLEYTGDGDSAKQATLLQTAIDKKVDGIAVTLANPEAMSGGMAAAKAAGIPTVVVNAGLDDWKKQGALSFFGLDIQSSGVQSGEVLGKAGGKRGICVIQEAGNKVLDELCKGAASGFGGAMETLQVNGTDMPSVESTLQAKLAQDKDIDSIVTLNSDIGLAALSAEKTAGSSAKITTLNMSKDLVEPIKSGAILATIDQQGWLQGYSAVDALWLYKYNANIVGSGQPVLTGPTLITKDNIDVVAPLVERGTR